MLKIKQVTEYNPQESEGVIEREEINPNDLSQFSSEHGLIGKHIFIPKLVHSLGGETRVASTSEIKKKCSKDYPHVIATEIKEEDPNIYRLISGLMELRFLSKKKPFEPVEN